MNTSKFEFVDWKLGAQCHDCDTPHAFQISSRAVTRTAAPTQAGATGSPTPAPRQNSKVLITFPGDLSGMSDADKTAFKQQVQAGILRRALVAAPKNPVVLADIVSISLAAGPSRNLFSAC